MASAYDRALEHGVKGGLIQLARLQPIMNLHWPGTILLIVLIVAATGFGFATYWLARGTLRGQSVRFRWKEPWHEVRTYLGVTTLLLATALSAISYGAINGVANSI